MSDDRLRYFIINSGRCGSSLLAAILADSGADFGLPVPADWSQDEGALEHPDIDYVSRQFRRAAYLLPRKRSSLLVKYQIDIRQSRAKKRARQVLSQVGYAKTDNLDLWTWHVTKMGYHPRIIVSYRDFAATARSFFILRGLHFHHFAENYSRTYENALMMLDVYGGCAVAFEEMVNPNETAWADALSQATGLPRDRLLHHRDERLKEGGGRPRETAGPDGAAPAANRPKIVLESPRAAAVEAQLRRLKGCYLPPSAQIRRKWGI
ncbi:hypothetical protein [Pelagibius sp.]|uniref:hypothetical protein n=1 Tax=Pelagibius sp. TaxID=1931238 RepID=UPI003B50FAA0